MRIECSNPKSEAELVLCFEHQSARGIQRDDHDNYLKSPMELDYATTPQHRKVKLDLFLTPISSQSTAGWLVELIKESKWENELYLYTESVFGH